jgi:hypothetical protein
VGWDWVNLVRRPQTVLLYQLQMIDYGDSGAVGGMKIGRGTRSTRRKPATVPLCPPQILHDLTWARTQAAAVGSRRLTAWAVARPNCALLTEVFVLTSHPSDLSQCYILSSVRSSIVFLCWSLGSSLIPLFELPLSVYCNYYTVQVLGVTSGGAKLVLPQSGCSRQSGEENVNVMRNLTK